MNQRGFATIAILALLPLIMTIIAVTMSLWLLMKGEARAKHRCRMELLASQNEVSTTLQSLLALNAPARALRIKKKVAEAVRDLGTPIQKIKAQAALQIIERQQWALDRQQKILIARGRSLSTQKPWVATEKIKRDLIEHSRIVDSTNASISAIATVGKFDVAASPPGQLAPEYLPSPHFEANQIMGARWQVPVSVLVPKWTHPLLASTKELRLRGKCSVSLRQNKISSSKPKGGQRWLVHLEMDR